MKIVRNLFLTFALANSLNAMDVDPSDDPSFKKEFSSELSNMLAQQHPSRVAVYRWLLSLNLLSKSLEIAPKINCEHFVAISHNGERVTAPYYVAPLYKVTALNVYDTLTGDFIIRHDLLDDQIDAISFTSDGKIVVASHNFEKNSFFIADNTINIWDLEKKHCLVTIRNIPHSDLRPLAIFNVDGTYFAFLQPLKNTMYYLSIIDLSTKSNSVYCDIKTDSWIQAIFFDNKSKNLFCKTVQGSLYVINIETQEITHDVPAQAEYKKYQRSSGMITISHEDTIYVHSDADGFAHFFDTKTHAKIHSTSEKLCEYDTYDPRSLFFGTNDGYLIINPWASMLLIDLKTEQCLYQIVIHTSKTTLELSPNQEILIAAPCVGGGMEVFNMKSTITLLHDLDSQCTLRHLLLLDLIRQDVTQHGSCKIDAYMWETYKTLPESVKTIIEKYLRS